MKNSDNENISNSNIKDHSEILQIIDKIRAYEQNFVDFSTEIVEEVEDIKQDLIEVEYKEVIPEEEVLPEEDKKKFSFLKKEKKEAKPTIPTTFKIGFDEKGELVNLDLKKPKPKKEKEGAKGKFNLKKIIPFKKKGAEDAGDKAGSSSKLKGLKGGLGKLSKLKKVIPTKNKSSNEETKE